MTKLQKNIIFKIISVAIIVACIRLIIYNINADFSKISQNIILLISVKLIIIYDFMKTILMEYKIKSILTQEEYEVYKGSTYNPVVAYKREKVMNKIYEKVG